MAQRYKVSRNTVAKALASPVPTGRKKPPPRKSVLEPVKGFIDAMLREDLDVWKKQKHTVDRILERLAGEHDFEQASYSTVRDYVRKRRPQIVLEAKEGRRHLEGTVPQEKRPGEEAEVDFADVWLDLAGQRRKCVLFTLRMSYSGKAVHRLAGGVLRRACGGVSGAGRGAFRAYPLRQPQARGEAGAVRPVPHGDDTVGGLQILVWIFGLLLRPW